MQAYSRRPAGRERRREGMREGGRKGEVKSIKSVGGYARGRFYQEKGAREGVGGLTLLDVGAGLRNVLLKNGPDPDAGHGYRRLALLPQVLKQGLQCTWGKKREKGGRERGKGGEVSYRTG